MLLTSFVQIPGVPEVSLGRNNVLPYGVSIPFWTINLGFLAGAVYSVVTMYGLHKEVKNKNYLKVL